MRCARGVFRVVPKKERLSYRSETLDEWVGFCSHAGLQRSSGRNQWRTPILSANAVTGPPPNHTHQDFTPGELKEGKAFYFEQADNLSGMAIYRLHMAEVSANRLVFDIENVSVIRRLLVTLFPSG